MRSYLASSLEARRAGDVCDWNAEETTLMGVRWNGREGLGERARVVGLLFLGGVASAGAGRADERARADNGLGEGSARDAEASREHYRLVKSRAQTAQASKAPNGFFTSRRLPEVWRPDDCELRPELCIDDRETAGVGRRGAVHLHVAHAAASSLRRRASSPTRQVAKTTFWRSSMNAKTSASTAGGPCSGSPAGVATISALRRRPRRRHRDSRTCRVAEEAVSCRCARGAGCVKHAHLASRGRAPACLAGIGDHRARRRERGVGARRGVGGANREWRRARRDASARSHRVARGGRPSRRKAHRFSAMACSPRVAMEGGLLGAYRAASSRCRAMPT